MDKMNPSLLVYRQLPAFIVEDYPQFALFLKKYYEWAEQTDNGVGRLRNIDTFWDVDVQNDENILQYLYRLLIREIPNAARIDRKFLLKNISQFYKSKGSVESIETLFRMVYGEEIEIYLPKEDVIKVSEGNWRKVVAITIDNIQYLNGDAASLFDLVGAEVFQTDTTGAIVARGVVEDVDDEGVKQIIYLSVDKQLREFDLSLQLRCFDPTDPEIEARIDALIGDGKIIDFVIRDNGRGYSRQPQVVIEGGRFNAGNAAAASVSIVNGEVSAITITNPGRGYIAAPKVRVVNEIRANIQGNLGEVSVSTGGEFYVENTNVTVLSSNNTGEKFSIDVVRGGSIESVYVESGGDKFSPLDQIVFDNVDQNNNNELITPNDFQYSIWRKEGVSSSVSSTRFKYTTIDDNGNPFLTTGRSPARLVSSLGREREHSLTQTIPGDTSVHRCFSVYVKHESTSAFKYLVMTIQAEKPAKALVVVASERVFSIDLVDGGSNYSTAPAITFNHETGTGATATAVLTSNAVSSITFNTLTDGGSGYNDPPQITFGSTNYLSALYELGVTDVQMGGSSGTASDYKAGVETVGDGVYRYWISGKINFGNQYTVNMKFEKDVGDTWTTDDNVLVYGALVNEGDKPAYYIESKQAISAEASIGELLIDDILFENDDRVAAGDDIFVLEDGNNGRILSARVTNSGSKYISTPTATVTNIDAGSNFSVVPVIGRGGAVTRIDVVSAGGGYIDEGESADEYRLWQASLTVFNGQILRRGNNLYRIDITDGTVSKITGVTPPTHTSGFVIFTSGARYTYTQPAATITISPPNELGGRYVNSISVGSGGTGYVTPPMVEISQPTDPNGTQAKAYAVLTGSSVSSIVVYDKGSGYDNAIVTIAPPPDDLGAVATGTPNLLPVVANIQATAEPVFNDSGSLTSVTITNGGAGYTTPPTVTISEPIIISGSTPLLSADIEGAEVVRVDVIDGGSGYTTPPTITIDEPSSPILSIQLTASGTGYTVSPSVIVTGGGGSGVEASAIINTAGEVVTIVLTDNGSGYTTAPTVTLSANDDTGTGATATAVISSSTATATQATATAGFDATISSVSAASDTITMTSGDAAKIFPNDIVRITTTGTMPGGLTSGAPYHVVRKSGNSFGLSLDPNGTPVDITSAGSGTRTLSYFDSASERLEAPTDTVGTVYEDGNYVISEINEDRYHLTIPEKDQTYVIPADVYSAQSVNFEPSYTISNPAEIVASPAGVNIKYDPDPPDALAEYVRYVQIEITDVTLFNALSSYSAIKYETTGTVIPGLVNGETYYVFSKDTGTNQVLLAREVGGPPITFSDTGSIVLGGQIAATSVVFSDPLDAAFVNETDLATLENDDAVIFYATVGSTLPSGLTDNQTYFITAKSSVSGYIKFAATPGGPTIAIAGGSSGTFRIIKLGDLSDHTFTTVEQHLSMNPTDSLEFADGDLVTYTTTGTAIGNLISERTYKITNIDNVAGTFELIEPKDSTTITITSIGSGTQTITKVTSTANRFVFSADQFSDIQENAEVLYIPTGGVTATATAAASALSYSSGSGFSGGAITGTTITEDGANYVTAPIVTITDSATARPIGALVLLSGGSGYFSAPTVSIDGGGGSGATATATIDGFGVVDSITLDTEGSDYLIPPVVTFTGGGGSGASAVATILLPGSGATATATISSGNVTAITITNAGINYILPVVSIEAPNTKVLPIQENRAYWLVNKDEATRSFNIAESSNGLPIRLLSAGTGTHTFQSNPQYVEYDMAVANNYINDANDILYTSIKKTGDLSSRYDDLILTQSLDRILLETSFVAKQEFDGIGLEDSPRTEIAAVDSLIQTGDSILFSSDNVATVFVSADTDSDTADETGITADESQEANIGLTPGTFYFVNKKVDSIGNGFTFHTTEADALADENPVALNTTVFSRSNDVFRLVRYNKTTLEVGEISSVNLFNKGKMYKSLPRMFVNVSDARFGDGAILRPIGEGIGAVRRMRIDDPGFDYETNQTLTFTTNLHLYEVNGSFSIGETVTVSATAKGTVVGWDAQTTLLRLSYLTGATFTVDTTVTGSTSGATGKILEIGKAAGVATPKAIANYGGFYYGRKNLIDEFNIRVQDSRIYQDFSYVIKSSKPYSSYEDVLKRNVHPAGLYVTGFVDYQINPENQSINTVNLTETIVEVEDV